MDNSGGSLEDQNVNKMWTVKARLMKFHKGTQTILGIGLQAILCYILAKTLILYDVLSICRKLYKTEIQINLEEEILR